MDASQFKLIDTAIGLMFIFLIVSIAVTALVEGTSALLRLRSANLVQSLIWMLGERPDPAAARSPGLLSRLAGWLIGHKGVPAPAQPVVGREAEAAAPDSLTRQVLKHPLVDALAAGERVTSHIDPKLFASVFVTVLNDAKNNTSPFADVNAAFADVAKLVGTVKNGAVRNALAPMIAGAQAAVATQEEKAKAAMDAVAQWYDQSMTLASDWYKARMQMMTLVFAALATVGGNIDTFRIASALWNDEGLRQTYVTQATAAISDPEFLKNVCPAPGPAPADGTPAQDPAACVKAQYQGAIHAIKELNRLPVGWRLRDYDAEAAPSKPPGDLHPPQPQGSWWNVLKHVPGWLMTIAAASLGAPFWFGMLQRIIPMRGGRADGAGK